MQIVRFGLVGGVATATHLAVVTGLLYEFPAIHPLVANVAAFTVAFIVSFIGHSRFTFRARGHWLKFLMAALAGLCANNLVLVVLGIGGAKFVHGSGGIVPLRAA